jgi:hypothetical protein
MSVRLITSQMYDPGASRAADWGASRPSPAGSGETPGAAPDRAVVSEQARQLYASLVGRGEAPKLHLSPTELRELVTPARKPFLAPNGVAGASVR